MSSARKPTDGSAEDLSDELLEIQTRTVDGEYVQARVSDIAAVNDTEIKLTVTLPNGEACSFRLEKPLPWSDEYLFARIAEAKGYEPGSIQLLVGDNVLVEPDGSGGWELIDPISGTQRLKDALLGNWRPVAFTVALTGAFLGIIGTAVSAFLEGLNKAMAASTGTATTESLAGTLVGTMPLFVLSAFAFAVISRILGGRA